MITRRDFVKSGIAASFGGIIVPPVLARGVAAATNDQIHNNRVIVVVQLGGGNDGLNTVVPLTDPAYAGLRPRLGVRASDALALTSDFGLHPSLPETQSLFRGGKVAIVQGVGYPKPDYSHFQSMAVWAHGDPAGGARSDGWLGRFLQNQVPGYTQPLCACAIGDDSIPLELQGSQNPAVTTLGLDGKFSYWGGSGAQRRAAAMYSGTPGMWGMLMDNNLSTVNASVDAIAAANYTSAHTYVAPGASAETRLATAFKTAAKVIATQPAVKIIHLSHGSFDTHSDQLEHHAKLLADLDFCIGAFLADLTAHQLDSRVTVMTWSEFGRRAAENGSSGSDHGSAAPLLLYGTPVAGGFYGAPCSLTNLDHGNLKYTTDFRSVYQDVIGSYLGGDPAAVLGGSFPALGMFH